MRPTSIAEVKEKLSRFRSDEASAAVEAFEPRASDVFISTYSKSGTTWMQQVVHQLRSQGNTDYTDISEVVPWLESAVDVGIDPSADQPGGFRAFKCHLLFRDLPKGGRYITVYRDPMTVLPSFFRFFEGWWFEPGSISIDEFALEMYVQGSAAGRHWDHLVEWWDRIEQSDTLVLCYEDMLLAPERVPPLIADFLGLSLEPETMSTIVKHCSRHYMVEHASLFEERLIRQHRDAYWGLPSGGDASKVAAASAPIVLERETVRALQKNWSDIVKPALGFNDYKTLRAALPNPLGVERN